MLIISDMHLGVQRKAGTTPDSREALRSYLFGSFRAFLEARTEDHLIAVGDIFDSFEIAPRDWVETWLIFSQWLSRGKRLTLVAGNHDWSPRGAQVSSFEMLARVLSGQSDNVQVVGLDEWARVDTNVIALAHCSNQQVFDVKLDEVLGFPQRPTHLLLHANYDNAFTEHSDHSLNVRREQAEAFAERGITLVFAHEHQARRVGDHLIVMGNQWPTSIADCQHNPGNAKFAHVLRDGSIERIETWSADGPSGYLDIDWTQIGTADLEGVEFVRISGDATASQSSEVINAIAALRRTSSAFIVSNAVRIEGIVQAEELPESFEVARRFDVLQYIREHLEPAEMTAVEELLKDAQA